MLITWRWNLIWMLFCGWSEKPDLLVSLLIIIIFYILSAIAVAVLNLLKCLLVWFCVSGSVLWLLNKSVKSLNALYFFILDYILIIIIIIINSTGRYLFMIWFSVIFCCLLNANIRGVNNFNVFWKRHEWKREYGILILNYIIAFRVIYCYLCYLI